MILVKVTLTGVDERIDPWDLVLLHEEFPFVEFGVLFSRDRQGKENRYPSKDWIEKLVDVVLFHNSQREVPMALSAHLCGHYARDVISTYHYEENDTDYISDWQSDFKGTGIFRRVQLNRMQEYFNKICQYSIGNLLGWHRQVILQTREQFDKAPSIVDYFEYDPMKSRFSVLYDVSGGTGMLPNGWAEAVPGKFCGYAGGLNPDNVAEELQKIAAVAGSAKIWIDMESGVREDDWFSLEKARRVLEIAKTYKESNGLGNSD